MTMLYYFLIFVGVFILSRICLFSFENNGFRKVRDEQGFEVAKGHSAFLMATFTMLMVIAAIIKFYFL